MGACLPYAAATGDRGRKSETRAALRSLRVVTHVRAAAFGLLLLAVAAGTASADDSLILVTDEADAALAILDAEAAGRAPTAADWQRLFASEGYRLLARREASMKRAFSEEDFRRFLTAPETIAAAPALGRTLGAWRARQLDGAQRLAHAYLPKGTPLRARVLPVIKPKHNSFVFAADGTRFIFLYVDPEQSAARFENTVAHELHHTGLAAACREPDAGVASSPVALARTFVGAFGEGIAMLAAAGGPDVHPHAVSPAADRARWDADLRHADGDLGQVARFLDDILDGKLKDEASAFAAAAPFWGVQGAWYTVGWKMATAIERALGRDRLIADACDPAVLLADYDRVAAPGAARWSEALIRRLRGP